VWLNDDRPEGPIEERMYAEGGKEGRGREAGDRNVPAPDANYGGDRGVLRGVLLIVGRSAGGQDTRHNAGATPCAPLAGVTS